MTKKDSYNPNPESPDYKTTIVDAGNRYSCKSILNMATGDIVYRGYFETGMTHKVKKVR